MRPNLAPTVATTTPVPKARVTGGKLLYQSIGEDIGAEWVLRPPGGVRPLCRRGHAGMPLRGALRSPFDAADR